jgi:hypothetical protein
MHIHIVQDLHKLIPHTCSALALAFEARLGGERRDCKSLHLTPHACLTVDGCLSNTHLVNELHTLCMSNTL